MLSELILWRTMTWKIEVCLGTANRNKMRCHIEIGSVAMQSQVESKKSIDKIWWCQIKIVILHPQMNKQSFDDRGVEQLVARQAHNLEVACSSPASAT